MGDKQSQLGKNAACGEIGVSITFSLHLHSSRYCIVPCCMYLPALSGYYNFTSGTITASYSFYSQMIINFNWE